MIILLTLLMGNVPLTRAIEFLGKRYKDPVPSTRAQKLGKWFAHYGHRWKVDPWLSTTIACQESRFRDRPRRIKVERCKTVISGDRAISVCRKIWPGERGVMQIIPRWARESFHACKGRYWNTTKEFDDTETNICVGTHLLAKRRRIVQTRKLFLLTGGRYKFTSRFKPCTQRHYRFCSRNKILCKRWWWVASWNWGPHRVLCRKRKRRHDFVGYPIKILRRYRLIVEKFAPSNHPLKRLLTLKAN